MASDQARADDDVRQLHGMGYAQELSRRMSGFSNFAISFSIICVLAGGIAPAQERVKELNSSSRRVLRLRSGRREVLIDH